MSKKLHIKIDGTWTATDLSSFVTHLNRLYQYHMIIDMAYRDYRDLEEYFDFPRPSRLRREFGYFRHAGFGPDVVEMILEEKEQLETMLTPKEMLHVDRIAYASPGSIDLTGVGKAVDALARFVQFLIEYCGNSKMREIERDLKSEELREKRIENARRHMSALKEMGYSKTEIRRMIAVADESQGPILELVSSAKILRVTTRSSTKK